LIENALILVIQVIIVGFLGCMMVDFMDRKLPKMLEESDKKRKKKTLEML